MPVESSMHGILIGPQGTTIRSIEEACGVTVRFERLPESCLIIKGTSEERACAMKKATDILELASSERIVALEDKYSLNNIRVLVKNNGEIVRQIETETDSRIRIDMDTAQRKFRVRGSPEGREKAIAMVFAQLDAAIERFVCMHVCIYVCFCAAACGP
jgi:rRNA processing protein Krr1/Pno1